MSEKDKFKVSFSSKYIPAGVKGVAGEHGAGPAWSYAWSQYYKRQEFVKFPHLLAAKPSNNDSWELEVKTSCSQPLTGQTW